MRTRLLHFACGLALLIAVRTAVAAEEPTLADTTGWLAHKLNGYTYSDSISGVMKTNTTYEEVEFERCTGSWLVRSFSLFEEGVVVELLTRTHIDLATLDPTSLKLTKALSVTRDGNAWFFVISTTNGVLSVRTDHLKGDESDHPTSRTTKISMSFGSEGLARRVGTALVHATRICGGKESAPEPF